MLKLRSLYIFVPENFQNASFLNRDSKYKSGLTTQLKKIKKKKTILIGASIGAHSISIAEP